MTDFQSKGRRLPAEMKAWKADHDLRTLIDRSVETIPILKHALIPQCKQGMPLATED
jgi:hypothetical protein